MNHSDYRLMAVGVKNERHEIVTGKEILANISRFLSLSIFYVMGN